MSVRNRLRAPIFLAGTALASTLLMQAAPALAADAEAAAPPKDATTVQEVVVTGSFIAGTAKDAALPVSVVSSEELKKQGSPTVLELLKALPVSNGVLGETNQFDARAQGSEGSGSVNLRGLGAERTLVLLNGRRMSINPLAGAGSGIVDTNVIPAAAIGRVEVLKDGAAATYGSDAIAGVVNFITRKRFTGLEVGGSYKLVDSSDGDYNLNATYGYAGDTFNILIAAGWDHRSPLSAKDRSWANRAYLENPEGGWSGGADPAIYAPLAANLALAGGLTRDAGCGAAGGYPGFSGTSPRCQFHYIPFDNIVEKEDHLQLYGELNADLSPKMKFHLEGLIAHSDVPDWHTSPSYLALSSPTLEAEPAGATAGRYIVPATNPGLIAYFTSLGQAVPAGGVQLFAGTFRPYAVGGNPMWSDGSSRGTRGFQSYRISAGLSGDLDNGIHWDTGLTYSTETGRRSGYDTMVNRLELALRGLGGPACNYATGTPGVGGCLYFNPFSNAVAANILTGAANPNYNAAVANSTDLARWMFQKSSTEQTASVTVFDAVLSGKAPITLPGGQVGWAAGGQFRHTYFRSTYSDLGNASVTPCVNTPEYGVTNCTGATRNGPFVFLGVATPQELMSDIYAGFGELSLPITTKLNAQLAARYEDYGGQVGSTFNPKLALRWQVVDSLALRASAGSTFRGPPDAQLSPNNVTSLQSIAGSFRAVDIGGNPNLKPEKADTYNFGAILKMGNLRATIDWWSFDFKNPIVAEPVAGIFAAVFPTGAPANCASPLASRFTFNNLGCAAANITRLQTYFVNGAPVKTSGIDIDADYRWENAFMGGDLTVGGSATINNEYKVGATYVGGNLASPAFDAVGYLNYQTTAVPIPKWKGEAHADFTLGDQNLRWQVRYIDSYEDQRTAPFSAGAYRDTAGNAITVAGGKTIKAQITHDLTYRVFLPQQTTLSASILNVFDTDPSFARLDLSYDPFTGNPLGRVFKINVSKKY
jgi:iron complex outermembrane recepter protein